MKPIPFLLAASFLLFVGHLAHSEDSLPVLQYMQSVSLHGADGITAFTGHIETAPVLVAALNAPLFTSNGHNLLSKENEKKWKIFKGDWKIENNVLTGSGESYIVFHEAFYPPFMLQFSINVLDGLRAHVGFGPLSFNDVGYDTDFGFWPKTGGKMFHFQRKVMAYC